MIEWYTPNIDNAKVFWTDANGLEMQERKVNYRPTWEFSSKMEISSNYYPVNTAMAIRDTSNNL